jgi:hypothetical protein
MSLMIQFFIGASLMGLGICIILAVRRPEDKNLPRDQVVPRMQILLSNFVLILIMAGGALMALALV